LQITANIGVAQKAFQTKIDTSVTKHKKRSGLRTMHFAESSEVFLAKHRWDGGIEVNV
jgi:hypothetical protein